MSLLSLTAGHLAYGHVALLDGVDFSIDAGERVALIGRNGTGKSSMLKALAGLAPLDDGQIVRRSGSTLAFVPQEPVFDPAHSVYEAVAAAMPEQAARITQYQHLGNLLAGDAALVPDDALEQMARLQGELDASDGWAMAHRIERILSQLGLSATATISTLSGGTKKRVALARALVAEPDLLLLDEPTNHLDIESIAWLEELLVSRKEATLLITHDRQLMDRVATRIVELDRGILRSYPGSYAAYQARKADELAQEDVINAKFDKLLAQEEVWIRQGVEARRTRNEGRVRRLEQLRRQRAQRREQVGSTRIEVDAGERSGKLVAELTQAGKAWADRWIVRGLDCVISRGDRVGLIGPNGAGKTTLLRLILGDLEPDEGQLRLGTQLNVAYFDQMRAQLDDEATLADTISPGSEWVEIGGTRTHVMSYLGRFLFAPERARSPVKSLSGGERNRLLLARLFARPANLLVLDEPTNDLDIETLELLEELLADYSGTVLLVSHDRAFLDAVVTQSLAFEGEAHWLEYAGGFSDVIAARGRRAADLAASGVGRSDPRAAHGAAPVSAAPVTAAATPAAPAVARATADRTRLSYKEQRELQTLPARIAALETEQAQLSARLADSRTYQDPAADIGALNERFARIEEELMECLDRWEKLESRSGA